MIKIGKLYRFVPSGKVALFQDIMFQTLVSDNKMYFGHEYIVLVLDYKVPESFWDSYVKLLWDGAIGWTSIESSDTFEMIEND